MKTIVTEEHVNNAILKAGNLTSNLHKDILNFEGMSTDRTRHLFNNLGNTNEDINYLEIGTWCGATFCSTLYNNRVKGYVIDNFSEFDDMYFAYERQCIRNEKWQEQGFFHPRNAFYFNLGHTKGLDIYKPFNFSFFEFDCFKFNINILPKIDFYFYDGSHSPESQYKAYTHYNPILSERFLTIIDDYDDSTIRESTMKAFNDLNYKIIYHRHLSGGNKTDIKDKNSWWNGYGVFIIEK